MRGLCYYFVSLCKSNVICGFEMIHMLLSCSVFIRHNHIICWCVCALFWLRSALSFTWLVVLCCNSCVMPFYWYCALWMITLNISILLEFYCIMCDIHIGCCYIAYVISLCLIQSIALRHAFVTLSFYSL